MAEFKKVDVGFQGGQMLALRIAAEEHEKLKKALGDPKAERWHALRTQDSDVSVDLSQVVYVRVDTEDHRVGFQG